MIRIATAALFSELAVRFFEGRLHLFQVLLLFFSVAMAVGAWCLRQCPTRPLTQAGGNHPLRALRFVREDPLFRRTLICWMLMGFANLMMLPMRVEYLANPRYGLSLDAHQVAFLTGVLPNLARLVLSPFWGHWFDRMNFFTLRVVLNLGFAIGIVAFFTTDHLLGWIVAALVFGVSNAGGDVAWSLWVTKFAPPERVADYMSVHTFFTGLRGVAAPLLAFHLVKTVSIGSLALFSGLLILLASLLLLPEIPWGKTGRKAAPALEEVSE
jgi:hypothetical protein